jgi:hypothetical protein
MIYIIEARRGCYIKTLLMIPSLVCTRLTYKGLVWEFAGNGYMEIFEKKRKW